MDKHINFSSEEERQAYELLKQIRDYERSLTEDERKRWSLNTGVEPIIYAVFWKTC